MSGKPEEYEIEESPAEVITGHFQKSIKDVELAKKLSRYYELKTEIEILEQRKEEIGKELKEAGKGVESLMAGDYAAFFQKVSGRVSTDWKQAYRDAVGEMPSEDVSKYVKKGDDTIRMEVKKIR
jgi:predicted phage-related endonuclease